MSSLSQNRYGKHHLLYQLDSGESYGSSGYTRDPSYKFEDESLESDLNHDSSPYHLLMPESQIEGYLESSQQQYPPKEYKQQINNYLSSNESEQTTFSSQKDITIIGTYQQFQYQSEDLNDSHESILEEINFLSFENIHKTDGDEQMHNVYPQFINNQFQNDNMNQQNQQQLYKNENNFKGHDQNDVNQYFNNFNQGDANDLDQQKQEDLQNFDNQKLADDQCSDYSKQQNEPSKLCPNLNLKKEEQPSTSLETQWLNNNYQPQNQLGNKPNKTQKQKSKKSKKIQKDKKISDVNDIVRQRKQITERINTKTQQREPVKQKSQQKRTHFHNHIKNFLKQGVKHLIRCLPEFTQFTEVERDFFYTILSGFTDKRNKNDMYFIINQFPNLTEEQYNNFINKFYDLNDKVEREVKFNPEFKASFLIRKIMIDILHYSEQQINFKCFTNLTILLNKLNSFNRIQLRIFCEKQYIPIIFKKKADKIDQLYTNNYIKTVLTNPKIIE